QARTTVGKTVHFEVANSVHYLLVCKMKALGCITPVPGKDYYVFNKNTKWKMPGAGLYHVDMVAGLDGHLHARRKHLSSSSRGRITLRTGNVLASVVDCS